MRHMTSGLYPKDFSGNSSILVQMILPLLCFDRPYQPKFRKVLVTNQKGIAIHKWAIWMWSFRVVLFMKILVFMDSKEKARIICQTGIRFGDPYSTSASYYCGYKTCCNDPDGMKSKAVVVNIQPDGNHRRLCYRTGMNFLARNQNTETLPFYWTQCLLFGKEYVPADLNSSRGSVIQVKMKMNYPE